MSNEVREGEERGGERERGLTHLAFYFHFLYFMDILFLCQFIYSCNSLHYTCIFVIISFLTLPYTFNCLLLL